MVSGAPAATSARRGFARESEGASDFRHESLLYSGDAQYIEGTVPAISRALARERPVLVAVSPARISLLREALGAQAAHVSFADIHALGRNPARLISAWHDFLEEHSAAGEAALGIGEPIWPGRTPSQIDECERYERLLDLAFAGGRPWRLLCPYDRDRLDERVIEGARHNHPVTPVNGAGEGGVIYGVHDWLAQAFSGELPEPSVPAHQMDFNREQLTAVRMLVAAGARDALLADVRVQQLVLAVNELASNSVRYGGGAGSVRLWREPGSLVCEVRDGGHIQAPLAGRRKPKPDQPTGRGLWLVNQLCDFVQIRSDHAGTVVRVHMGLNADC
jgi:anti-sigma regulatory factor (Ser/Thr protein kinase)